jgi:hypothetical protein
MYASVLFSLVIRLREVFAFSYRHIASLLDVSKSTVHRWISLGKPAYHKKKSIKRCYLIDTARLVKAHPFQSLQDIIQDEQLEMSTSTLSRYFRKDGFSKKKVKNIGKLDMQSVILGRQLFSKKMQDIDWSSVISVDETSLYTNLTPLRAWSQKSKPLSIPLQRKQSKRFTMTVGITMQGSSYCTVRSGSSNSDAFMTFLKTLIDCPCKYVLMDNVSFHKSESVIKCLRSIGKEPLFVSPYSPEWNPVERVFSILKSHLRKMYNPATLTGTNPDVLSILKRIPQSTFTNTFMHVAKDVQSLYHV